MNNFEERLRDELDKLPKHKDNPSYSEGLGDGFEAGARWAANEFVVEFTKPLLTNEGVIDIILQKYHGHTREQWEKDLKNRYPYIELPSLVRGVWNLAQGREWFDNE